MTAGVLVLVAAGCRNNVDSVPPAPVGAPTVAIGGPAQVTGTTVKLKLQSSGVTIVAAAGDRSGLTAHYVVFVDQEPPAPGQAIDVAAEARGIYHTTDTSISIRGQNPGPHTYVVALADGTNARLGDTQARVTATVVPPGLSLTASRSSPSCSGSLVSGTPDGWSLPDATSDFARLDASGVTVVPPPGSTTSTTPETVLGATTTTSTTSTTVAAASGSTTTTAAAPTTTAAPLPATQITWFLDRVPTTGATAATDVGTVTAASFGLCLTGLPSGHHAVWAVAVDATGAPLVTPIETVIAFTTGQ
jgi:hypothetical protein